MRGRADARAHTRGCRPATSRHPYTYHQTHPKYAYKPHTKYHAKSIIKIRHPPPRPIARQARRFRNPASPARHSATPRAPERTRDAARADAERDIQYSRTDPRIAGLQTHRPSVRSEGIENQTRRRRRREAIPRPRVRRWIRGAGIVRGGVERDVRARGNYEIHGAAVERVHRERSERETVRARDGMGWAARRGAARRGARGETRRARMETRDRGIAMILDGSEEGGAMREGGD